MESEDDAEIAPPLVTVLRDLNVILEKAIEFEPRRDRSAPFPDPVERLMDSKRVPVAVSSVIRACYMC